jgi:ketosteroid isomerase-like protein
MSKENVEVVRRAIEAFNEGDLDSALRDAAPDVQVDWSRSRGVEAGVYSGLDEVRRFWTSFIETFDQITITPEDFIECGDDVVIPNLGRAVGRGGIPGRREKRGGRDGDRRTARAVVRVSG